MPDKNQPDEHVAAGPQDRRTHAAHPAADHAGQEIDLRELLLKLNRRRLPILGIFLLTVVSVGLYLFQAIPRYTAQTQLTLDLRQTRVTNIQEVLSGISADASVIGTEMDILRSTALMARLVDRLDLAADPEFNPDLRDAGQAGWLAQARDWISGLWALEAEAEPTPEVLEQTVRREVIETLQKNVAVEHRRQSHTITVAFTSEDPQRAAQLANTLAELYLTDQLEAKFEATRRANVWLAERLESMRNEVQAAEQAVKNVRERGDLIQTRGGTILEQQIGDVNAQLVEARVKISQAEARLRGAREIIGRPGGIESLGEVLDSRVIQQLRSDETTLRRKRAELGQRYGPRHPQMIQVDAEMQDLQAKLQEETARIIQSLENEVHVAKAAESALQRSLNQLRSQAGRVMETELELRELERQAESSRTLYENFLQRFQETREQDDLQRPDARIISPAEPPLLPSYPRKKMTLGLGALAGLMFGVMGAFVLETLDRGFRTGAQLEQVTGLPVLGMVPLLGRALGTPMEYVVRKQFSSLAESLRAIRTAIQLSNVDAPPKTVMITSALPREGKSSLASSLGRLAAQSGARVLLMDADLRRPTLAKMFTHVPAKVKLEDVLRDQAELKEAMVTDPDSGLHLLMAHGKAPAVGEMLGSQRMKRLLDKLKEHFDLIILDTPPIMGVSDGWTLARHVDTVVFVVHWAETPRDTVRAALRQLEILDIRPGGAILSMVNMRQQSRYGYGGYGYYYGKYKRYYHE